MIMVESRFRVANGMEQAVRSAFLNRPGLVDGVTGFLGVDVFTASDDCCVFHLVTRWTDHASYDTWHRGDAHRDSHAFIPKGLKLDAAFTRLSVLERLEPAEEPLPLPVVLADASSAVAQWLAEAEGTYVALLGAGGDTCVPNRALADRLGVPHGDTALAIAPLLANDEAVELAHRIAALRDAGSRGITEEFLLNLVNSSRSPFTLRCRMDVQRAYVLILAEDAESAEDHLRDELLQTNNQLAVLARERETQRKALDSALGELARLNLAQAETLATLEESFWHIQKIHEMLPICLDCGVVKTADGSWQPVRDFLVANARHPFLTHGYCPPCAERVVDALDCDESAR